MAYLDDGGLSRIIVTDKRGIAVYDNSVTDNAEGRYILLPEGVQRLKRERRFLQPLYRRGV